MDARETLVANIDRICEERKWKHYHLAKKMGVKPESLSRSLNGLPRIDTIEKIAKALDVPIASLFEDPDEIDGFVTVHNKCYRIRSLEQFEKIVEDSRPKLDFTLTISSDVNDDEGLPF